MATFRDLLEQLPASLAQAPRPPSEGPYSQGSGLAAWTLTHIMLCDDPDRVSAADRIRASKEIADRCEGRPRQAIEGIKDDLKITDFALHELSYADLQEFKRLCKIAAPGHLEAMGVET